MGKSNVGKKASISSTAPRRGKQPAAKKPAAKRVVKKTTAKASSGEDVHKYEVTRGPAPVQAFEDLGSLPESYGEQVLYLVARDPHWLFTYWEIDWSKVPKSRMLNGERRFYLRTCTIDGAEESRIEINPDARNWYIPAKQAPALYFVEAGYSDKKGVWQVIARSAPAATPSTAVSGDTRTNYATVPFHLTFQRLMEMMGSAVRDGETLTQVLSRLQNEGGAFAECQDGFDSLSDEQKKILAALFGGELIDLTGLSSGDIERLLRKRLLEKLSSESGSGLSVAGRTAPGVGSLSSAAAGWGPEVTSLFSALGAWGPGVSSLFSGLGAWGPGVSSLSSGAGYWGPEVSSLFSGIGASWSGQPFGAKRERGFFMHLNAEVIFYGGTHPDAKVWIDGKQINLNPDGSFRYHYRFPDGDYQIPIVAQSPDKVEERSAALSFKRATARKGEVGHTAQPRHLKKPVGRKKK